MTSELMCEETVEVAVFTSVFLATRPIVVCPVSDPACCEHHSNKQNGNVRSVVLHASETNVHQFSKKSVETRSRSGGKRAWYHLQLVVHMLRWLLLYSKCSRRCWSLVCRPTFFITTSPTRPCA